MKRIKTFAGATLILILASGQMAHSQRLLRKIQNKAEDKMVEKIFKEDEKKDQDNASQGNNTSSESSMSNTRGSGLTTSAPDVKENIKQAETAFAGKNYGQARYAVRQAMLGVEMEIGQNILDGLPEKVEGLAKDPAQDKVTSGNIGFVGLTIERVYQSNDQELRVTIGNDAALLTGVNMYLSAGGTTSSTDQNHKQITFKSYRGVLEYDESSGYTLSVPFGQTSILIVNGINFSSEQEIMKAAENIDIDKIKNELGEQ
ncbi:MAG TPA: hypothetical protein VE912_24960 [Bacteroidales bacterium]|nr:hypothetical protein [Bacteroidales bacterium]